MRGKCDFCGEPKETQRIYSIKDNEVLAGYQRKAPRKFVDACKECRDKRGGIAKIAESI